MCFFCYEYISFEIESPRFEKQAMTFLTFLHLHGYVQ
jgi:hypothetical protein